MKLTREEYKRGLISWDIDAKATVRTATADKTAELPEWSQPLADPSGSKIQSPPKRLTVVDINTTEVE